MYNTACLFFYVLIWCVLMHVFGFVACFSNMESKAIKFNCFCACSAYSWNMLILSVFSCNGFAHELNARTLCTASDQRTNSESYIDIDWNMITWQYDIVLIRLVYAIYFLVTDERFCCLIQAPTCCVDPLWVQKTCRPKHIIRGHSYIFRPTHSNYQVFNCTVAQSNQSFITSWEKNANMAVWWNNVNRQRIKFIKCCMGHPWKTARHPCISFIEI